MINDLNNFDLLDEQDLEKMSFLETVLYVQTLNEMEKLIEKDGEIND